MTDNDGNTADNPATILQSLNWRELMRNMRDDLATGVRVIRRQHTMLEMLLDDMAHSGDYWLLRSFSTLLRGIADALDVAIGQLENVATKALFVEPIMQLETRDEHDGSEPAP